jgi:hypothetical protein
MGFLLSIVFPNAHVYSESPLNTIVFGMEMGMGRAVAAACAGVLAMLLATGRKSERWAFVISALYLLRSPRFSGTLDPWFRMARYADIVFPPVLCVAAAYIIAYLRNKRMSDVWPNRSGKLTFR